MRLPGLGEARVAPAELVEEACELRVVWMAGRTHPHDRGDDPETLDRVRADLSLLPKVVDETIRRFCPARGVFRQTTRELELHGRTIPAGARIFALVGSANQDAERFPCPHAFDIDRDPGLMRQHVGFGQGIHKCIGIALAQLEIKVALELLLTRLPGLRPVVGQERPLAPGFIFSTPQRLEFEWDPA